jgi:hypothetical protein
MATEPHPSSAEGKSGWNNSLKGMIDFETSTEMGFGPISPTRQAIHPQGFKMI